MAAFVYRCPATGLKVQGFLQGGLAPGSASTEEVYETVDCTACRGVHLVNPMTGQVAGAYPKTKK
jgi:hypothetical protein